MVQRAQDTGFININCVDPLGRSALLMAIDNENLEMVELLIEHKVETKDALLHAISEEFVEAVEVLLDHEATLHKYDEPHVSILFVTYFHTMYFSQNFIPPAIKLQNVNCRTNIIKKIKSFEGRAFFLSSVNKFNDYSTIFLRNTQ